MEKQFDDIMNYSCKNKEVFEKLSALCRCRMIVPYIGAGLSKFAGFKTWDEFIGENKKCLSDTERKETNNIVVAGLIEEVLGKEKFREIIKNSFGGNWKYEDLERILKEKKFEEQAVSVIPKLFWGPIITTNFDMILEYIHKDILGFEIVLPKNLERKITQYRKERNRFLYKIHGCVSDTENIIITDVDYKKAYKENSEFEKSLENFFLGFHFLFIGCGLYLGEDGTKDKPVEVWEQLIEKNVMYHYAILECEKNKLEKRREELENRRIHPILYEKDKHESVKIILDKLLSEKNASSISEDSYYIAKKLLDEENERMKNLTIEYSNNDMMAIEKDRDKLTKEANKIYENIYGNVLLKYNNLKRK